MIKECVGLGLPQPIYFYNMSGFFVEFKKDSNIERKLETLILNDRQLKAITFLKSNGKITNSDYQTINACYRNTASNDLSELVDRKILESNGQKGAGAFYTLIAH